MGGKICGWLLSSLVGAQALVTMEDFFTRSSSGSSDFCRKQTAMQQLSPSPTPSLRLMEMQKALLMRTQTASAIARLLRQPIARYLGGQARMWTGLVTLICCRWTSVRLLEAEALLPVWELVRMPSVL